jgi:hypothetical protein
VYSQWGEVVPLERGRGWNTVLGILISVSVSPPLPPQGGQRTNDSQRISLNRLLPGVTVSPLERGRGWNTVL